MLYLFTYLLPIQFFKPKTQVTNSWIKKNAFHGLFGFESSLAFKERAHKMEIVGKKIEGCKIAPASFIGNPNSPSVSRLIECYAEELKQIHQIYQEGPYLKTSLNRICQTEEGVMV